MAYLIRQQRQPSSASSWYRCTAGASRATTNRVNRGGTEPGRTASAARSAKAHPMDTGPPRSEAAG
jgi:hypothetical protein